MRGTRFTTTDDDRHLQPVLGDCKNSCGIAINALRDVMALYGFDISKMEDVAMYLKLNKLEGPEMLKRLL